MRQLQQIKNYINRIMQQPLVRGTVWLLIGRGMSLVLQAAYFVTIARTLGVAKYGEFVTITALMAIVSPFVGMGIEILLLKNVAKNRTLFAAYWGNSLVITAVTGVGFILLLMLLAPSLLAHSISLLAILLVAVSDLIFGSITNIAGRSFQAIDRLNISAQIGIFLMFTKVLAAIALLEYFPNPTGLEWVWLYSASSVLSALFAVIQVQRYLGSPTLELSRLKSELGEGLSFSISNSATTIYSDIDKTMLGKLSTLAATGIYAAAYRLIDVAFIPVISICGAAYADFFRKGKDGIGAALAFAKPLVAISGSYSLLAGLGMLLLSPLVPIVLGAEYIPVVEALRWLSPIPLFRAMQHLGGDILSGSGFQTWRSGVETSIAGLNIALNLWLIPLYSWHGAAWASLVSDGLLMILFWLSVAFFYWKQKSQPFEGRSDKL
ncbi:oligosaccharide flippase family protein [Chamaesiphon minutus]|uniref:Membrane protein involved in the export of O-antigen and teichoic acid n=1 Tax=Chamaesiphon minutus (strain ATCC 27169 / PCC 6605) TaxID=1173020 RepID=K9UGV0_CHAP6|nr:oligosaccharide flippase family protein [Chamaesiphon minutus]AFY93868.1 membrane protein involved in the export of O-antigen and teichoic acid [Chamaesiphon minutus PCC 6605]